MSSKNQQQQQQLQERIRALEQQLEDKDDAYFELSATMVTIQAETTFEIKKMEKATKLEVNLSKEELRRTTQEANQAHMALARLQKQRQQQQIPVHSSTSLPPVAAAAEPVEQKPPSTIFITPNCSPTTVVFHTGPALARHLLMHSTTEDSIHHLLQHVQHSQQLQDTDICWQIMQSTHETNRKLWLKQALLWSATCRAMLRQACCCTTTDNNNTIMQPPSRIQVPIDLEAISSSLLNPLWKPETTPVEQQKSNPFDLQVCKEWMVEICSNPDDWHFISTLLRDCSCDEEREPWFQLATKDLISKWEAFCSTHILTSVRRRRAHSIRPPTAAGGIIISKSAFCQSLHCISDVFKKPIVQDRRAGMAILLDLLEYEVFSKNCNVKLMIGILGFLSTLCEEDTTLLCTKMATTDEEMAQSGLGVTILVLTTSQLQLEQLVDADHECHSQDYKNLEMMRNHTIRLFHQVLRRLRSSGICFSSLIDERKHDYLGVCRQILVSSRVDLAVKTMVRLQMDEIQADREDEEELKLK